MEAAIHSLDLRNNTHLDWLEHFYHLTHLHPRLATEDDETDTGAAWETVAEHAMACPAALVEPEGVRLFSARTHTPLENIAAMMLSYHRLVWIPASRAAATFIKACWRGYRTRRALMNPELPHNKRLIMNEYAVFEAECKKLRHE